MSSIEMQHNEIEKEPEDRSKKPEEAFNTLVAHFPEAFQPRTAEEMSESIAENEIYDKVVEEQDIKKLQMVERSCSDIAQSLADVGYNENSDSNSPREFSSDALTKSLIAGRIDSICATIPKVTQYENTSTDRYRGLKGDSIIKSNVSACRNNPQLVLMEGVRKSEVQGKYGSRELLFSDMVAPVEEAWL